MILHFKSKYEFKGDPEKKGNEIEFKARLNKEEKDLGFTILEFEENREGKIIKTRIEYSDDSLVIYTGPATLEFELNHSLKNNFSTENITIPLYTLLHSIEKLENGVVFNYEISNNESFEPNEKGGVSVFRLELNFLEAEAN